MSETLAEQAVGWARQLPLVDLRALAGAARAGPAALARLRADASHAETLLACASVAQLVSAGDGDYVAGLLDGAAAQLRGSDNQVLDVVWTGPLSSVNSSRLTTAVIGGLLAEAQHEIILVSYASYPPRPVFDALTDAAARAVEIILVAERPADRPGFRGLDIPLPGLPCTRLHWPATARKTEASLHAKILLVDGHTALVGSANFTGHAMERNLECSLLLRGGPVPGQIRQHLMTNEGITTVP